MTEDERRALGRTRRLVFQNLANGVPEEQIREALHLSELEVDQARRFVVKKITDQLTIQRQPPIPCQTMRDIRWNRRALLAKLASIGDLELSTSLITRLGKDGVKQQFNLKVDVQSLDHPEMIEGAQHRMNEAYR